jgi:hypothetical protein
MLAMVADAVVLFDGVIPVFGEAAASAQPCNRAFDHPAPGQKHEALCGNGALDHLQSPVPMALDQDAFGLLHPDA